MSANDDVEDIPATFAEVGVDNDGGDDDVVGENIEITNNQESSSRDSNNSNEDGVMVNTDNNGSGGDSDGVVVSEDAGREDMFLDAPEDLGADGRDSSTFTEAQGSTDGDEDSSQVLQTRFHGLDNEMQNDYMVDEMERLRAMLDKTLNEKESIVKEHKDEMEMAAKGIANLRDQMRDFTNSQLSLNESQLGSHNHFHIDAERAQLHDMIHECSMFLRSVKEEVQDLNTKSSEAVVSREVVSSYLNSVQNESAEIQFQKDQYMDDATNRMLNSFTSLVYVGDLSDNSTIGKIAHIEKSLYVLIENYNWFLYQSDQLRQCLTEGRPDLAGQTDYGVTFAAANDELLGFRKRETDFAEKLSLLENENSELKEQLEKHQAIAETVNAELERLKTELEQEKHRYSNTKEKLSLAVTKGKALVQQRDTLKQVLAERTSEVENFRAALQEKSSALEAAELIKEELVKSQISGAALQEVIVQKDLLLEKLEDILFQSGVPEGLGMKDVTEKTRWLVDERNALKDVSLKFHQLADALLSIDLPENFSFSDLESRLGWLTKSFDEAKAEIGMLQNEVSKTGEALNEAKAEIGALRDENVMISKTAHNDMEELTASLSMVLVEKDFIKTAFEDMSDKFEAIVQREHQVLSEKEQMLTILLESAGFTVADSQPSETANLVEKCLATLKERWSQSPESSEANEEILQNLQSLLYIKDQDLVLRDKLFEEETQKMKAETDTLYSDLRKASAEMTTLKEQNDNLKRDLEKIEDKSALIREKLSMAVKKGKGLVQEREGLKQIIEDKNSEIEKLKLELEQKQSTISEYESESSRLSAQVEGIPKLEEELLTLKVELEQKQSTISEYESESGRLSAQVEGIAKLEEELLTLKVELEQKQSTISEYESESGRLSAQVEGIAKLEEELLTLKLELEQKQSTISEYESERGRLSAQVEGIAKLEEELLTLKLELEQKQSTISDYELESGRLSAQVEGIAKLEEELLTLKDQRDQLERDLVESNKLADAVMGIGLPANISYERPLEKMKWLVGYLSECEAAKGQTEQQLENTMAEMDTLSSKFSEAQLSIKSLEDELAVVGEKFSQLAEEKMELEVARRSVEQQLERALQEASLSADADAAKKALENAFALAESNVLRLDKEKEEAELSRAAAEAELHQAKLDIAGLTSDLSKATTTVKALEDTVSEMETRLSVLNDELHQAKLDIAGLTSDLSKATTTVKALEDTVSEMETRLSVLNDESSEAQIGRAKLEDDLKKLKEEAVSWDSKLQDAHSSIKSLEDTLAKAENEISDLSNQKKAAEHEVSTLNAKLNACLEELAGTHGNLESRSLELFDHLKGLQLVVEDESVISSLRRCYETKYESLKEMEDLLRNIKCQFAEMDPELQPISEEPSHLTKFLSTSAAGISSVGTNTSGDDAGEAEDVSLFVQKIAESFRVKNRALTEQVCCFLSFVNESSASVLRELLSTSEMVTPMAQKMNSLTHENEKLEAALSDQIRESEHLKEQVQGSAVHEQELEEFKSKIVDMEVGLNRIIQKFSNRDMAEDQKLFAVDDLVQTLEKLVVAGITESEVLKSRADELALEVEKSIHSQQESVNLKKQVLYLEEGVQNIIKILRSDIVWDQKPIGSSDLIQVLEDLVMTVVSECQTLKSKAHELDSETWKSSNDQELVEVKDELYDIEEGLKKIIQKLRGDAMVDQRPVATRDLLQYLEKMIMALIMDTENSKAEIRELDSKLLGSQKISDELSQKVKSLEDSFRSRAISSDSIQERRIFEAPSPPPASEISEIEDVGSVSKATISPVPSSTHVRTIRKGSSSDHIAVDIDSESSRLIDHEESVEDKGHVFKSLNTSGLVPSQGKMIADRIDGLWVSSGRLLMSRPRARLGLVAYWLFLHLWLLGSIL